MIYAICIGVLYFYWQKWSCGVGWFTGFCSDILIVCHVVWVLYWCSWMLYLPCNPRGWWLLSGDKILGNGFLSLLMAFEWIEIPVNDSCFLLFLFFVWLCFCQTLFLSWDLWNYPFPLFLYRLMEAQLSVNAANSTRFWIYRWSSYWNLFFFFLILHYMLQNLTEKQLGMFLFFLFYLLAYWHWG